MREDLEKYDEPVESAEGQLVDSSESLLMDMPPLESEVCSEIHVEESPRLVV